MINFMIVRSMKYHGFNLKQYHYDVENAFELVFERNKVCRQNIPIMSSFTLQSKVKDNLTLLMLSGQNLCYLYCIRV